MYNNVEELPNRICDILKMILILIGIILVIKIILAISCIKKILCKEWKESKCMFFIKAFAMIFIVITLISYFLPKQNTLESISIQESKIIEAQKEMEIVVNILMNNLTQILWIRGIFFTIWMGFIGIILKEYYLSDSIRKRSEINKHKKLISILLLFVIFLTLGLELIIQVEQIANINRIWQLDDAVNKILLDPLQGIGSSSHSQIEDFQKIFACRNLIYLTDSSFCNIIIMIWNVVGAPTFFVFYDIVFIFWLIFPYVFLNKPDCNKETVCQRYYE